MPKVILESWCEGFKKVSLTKLQVEKLGMSLKESKNNVDFLMDDKKVILKIDNLDLANDFIEEIEKIGVNCVLLID